MPKSILERAIAEWKRIVGADNVHTGNADVDRAQTATYAVAHRVLGILRPGTREEVRACLRIASAREIAVYPISRGKNWGYGSKVPARDGAVILDLSRLDRIIAVDRVRGSVTVEPGVTVGALFAHLRRKAPGWAASLPGATTTEASVVGNALDGGIVHGPYGDRFAHVYSLEVVLGTGELLRTGLDRLPGGELLGGTEARVGPSLRDLFVQSNLGIVTEMTIGLFPLPKDLRRVRVTLDATEKISPLLDLVRQLKLERVLPDPVGLFNDYEAISVGIAYPWLATYGRTPLPTATLAQLRERLDRPRWVAVTEIASADSAIGEAREQAVRRALRDYDVDVVDITPARAAYYAPSGDGMFGLYWRKRGGAVADADPNRDRCGLLWCDYVIATDAAPIARAVHHVEGLVRSYGFEPAIELHAVWPRATYLVVSLAYDRDVLGEDDRAEACDRELTAYLRPFGAVPARRRVGSMDLLPAPSDDSAAILSRIKSALDPARIVAPGRYDGTARPPARVVVNREPGTAFAQVERAHRAVLERPPARGHGPLRPLFVDRARYELATGVAKRLLALLREIGPRLGASSQWRRHLHLDAARPLEPGAITGLLTGAFDATGRYLSLGFESSLAGLAESAALGGRSVPPGWSSPLRRPHARRPARADDLLANLAAFVALHDDLEARRLRPGDAALVEQHVPWTALVEGAPLLRRLVADKAAYALRPLRRSDGATWLGEYVTAGDWAKLVKAAARQTAKGELSWVAQARVRIEHQVFPLRRENGALEFEGCFVGVDVPVIAGRIEPGLVARIAERPRVGPGCEGTFPVAALVGPGARRRSPKA